MNDSDLNISVNDFIEYLKDVKKKIHENKDYITQLDATLGDGDHWINMDIGFTELVKNSNKLKQMNFPEMFIAVARIMMNSIGGSSGVLYGSGFLAAAKKIKSVNSMDKNELYVFLKAFQDGISKRGKCNPGDKTMLDTLYNATKAYKESLDKQLPIKTSLKNLKEGALQGMESTKNMKALKGRAYYQDNKSIGFLDPGAVTMYYQLDLMADSFLQRII